MAVSILAGMVSLAAAPKGGDEPKQSDCRLAIPVGIPLWFGGQRLQPTRPRGTR
jgi:hypothetical protein